MVFIVIGIWIYTALSALETEENSFPKKIILREGIVRTEEEVAEVLAREMDFDLQGAYKSGYSAADVVEYLIREPHKYPVSVYEGRFYEGRMTILYIIPLAVCIVSVIVGAGIIILKGKHTKS